MTIFPFGSWALFEYSTPSIRRQRVLNGPFTGWMPVQRRNSSGVTRDGRLSRYRSPSSTVGATSTSVGTLDLPKSAGRRDTPTMRMSSKLREVFMCGLS